MQVNSTLGAQILAAQTSQSATTDSLRSGLFMEALNAAKQKHNQAAPPAQPTHTAAYQALLDYMKESPEQHLRDKIMKDMGLTDQSLAAMPPGQRAAVEDAIAKKIREYMLAHTSTPPLTADASKIMTWLPS
jgi:hypothetical protein